MMTRSPSSLKRMTRNNQRSLEEQGRDALLFIYRAEYGTVPYPAIGGTHFEEKTMVQA